MQRYFVYAFLACVVFSVGCRPPQGVKDAWKETKYYYNTYLNTPATLNMDDTGGLEEYQAELGAAIAEFDYRLSELERTMQNSDRSPDGNWVTRMSSRFPWLSGIALTDETGYPHAQVTRSQKPFDVTPLLEEDPKQLLKDLRGGVVQTAYGPEIYLGNPVYSGTDFKGLIVVYFDPRGLLAQASDPGKVMIASPDGIIWPGIYDAESTPVAAINWGEVVADSSYGTVSNATGKFYWVTRYLGNLPLIYAIKIDGEFPERRENMAGLSVGVAHALGAVQLGMPAPPPEQAYAPEEVGNIGSPNVAPDAPPQGSPVRSEPGTEGAALEG